MARIPLAYTFGNHMHWVDMEWLWGYHVLPGSVRDMIRLCQEAGVKGCVNFDGIGYEKLAVENPSAFAELREAIQSGLIEVVGASYGQPYGLFHGGESNIRQRVYGIRTCMRLFGVRPRTFWEEEFDFFPQLPQILAGCGFTGASLYFQWTWHTPEIPREEVPVILWEGLDGTRLPTATRNRLNLHQWPEDMDILLKELVDGIESARKTARALHRAEGEGMIDRDDIEDTAITIAEGPKPLILQWLELMPSPDWMCRSEVILPKLRELLNDDRFDIERLTLGEYLTANKDNAPVRSYGMDDVWHGMTLGKNSDGMRGLSRDTERRLLAAEWLATTLSLFGRPYRQWDVYPTWELEEGWRHLLMAQHHDNDECEGLCGRVGRTHYHAAGSFAHGVQRQQQRGSGKYEIGHPFSWKPYDEVAIRGDRPISVKVENIDAEGKYLAGFSISEVNPTPGGWMKQYEVEHQGHPALNVNFTYDQRPEPGLNESIQLEFKSDRPFKILTDQPYSVVEVNPTGSWPKKYPSGDWMTSEQWFETVDRPFTSLGLVDLVFEDGSGLLILHKTAQQWFKVDDGVRCVLSAYDPWDEDYYEPNYTTLTFLPHGPMSNSDRWRLAHGQTHRPLMASFPVPTFSPVQVHAANVVATAFYREIEEFAGRGLDSYAGHGMGYPFILRLVEFDGIGGDVEVTLPGPIAKAVKTNLMGERASESQPSLSADVTSPQFPSVTGPLLQGEGEATSPVGQVGEPKRTGWGDAHPPALPDLPIKPGDPRALLATPEELAPFGIRAETITVPMRPYEIATIYLDLVPGRKQSRDLDAKREVWATVHRTS